MTKKRAGQCSGSTAQRCVNGWPSAAAIAKNSGGGLLMPCEKKQPAAHMTPPETPQDAKSARCNMQQMNELTQEQKAVLIEAGDLLGERFGEAFKTAVNSVAFQVNRDQANDPDNPIYDQMTRINQDDIPRQAWPGVERMRSAGLAERVKEPRGSGDEVAAMTAGLKAVIEALILIVQQMLGTSKELGDHLTGKDLRMQQTHNRYEGPKP